LNRVLGSGVPSPLSIARMSSSSTFARSARISTDQRSFRRCHSTSWARAPRSVADDAGAWAFASTRPIRPPTETTPLAKPQFGFQAQGAILPQPRPTAWFLEMMGARVALSLRACARIVSDQCGTTLRVVNGMFSGDSWSPLRTVHDAERRATFLDTLLGGPPTRLKITQTALQNCKICFLHEWRPRDFLQSSVQDSERGRTVVNRRNAD